MKTKRFFAASVLAMTVFAVPTIAAQALDISTADDFTRFVAQVNDGTYSGEDVHLKADINLCGATVAPIGTRNRGFRGKFYGNGKTISNAYYNGDNTINVGVFGFVNGGTVDNVTFSAIHVTNNNSVSSSLFNPAESTTGVAVGALNGGTLNNITVDSTCTVTGKLRTGGISGDASGTNSYITDCKNHANVVGQANYTGGIVGATHNLPMFSTSATGTHISGCCNHGEITGPNEVGGIAGYTDRADISDCHNSGAVSSTGNYGTGGIVGCDIYNPRGGLKPTKGSTIKNSDNSGTITTIRGGGILGSYVVSPSQSQNQNEKVYSKIEKCTNSGNIVSTSGKSGVIFGYQIAYASGDSASSVDHMWVDIIDCENTGTLNDNPVDVLTPSPYTTVTPSTQPAQ